MKQYLFFILILLGLLITSCSPVRRVPEGQYLLNRNKIKMEDARIKKSEIDDYLRQKPNRRLLGLYRFHLQVYNMADGFRENRLTRWMKNTIGEPPVIYDRGATQSTINQFELFMHSKGYFNARVSSEEVIIKQKINVVYQITGNTPYFVNEIRYVIPDENLQTYVMQGMDETLLKVGQRYDAELLADERSRITRELRDNGFFDFSRDFIFFQVDTNLNQHKLNIELQISDPEPVIGMDTIYPRHKRYRINDVVILPEYSALSANLPRTDTTLFVSKGRGRREEATYRFYHNEPLRIRPRVIASHLMVRSGEYFRVTNVEQSYVFLSEMRNFRFINLQFSNPPDSLKPESTDTLDYLNATLQLNRSAANAFTVEAEGLNTAGNLGVASNILYQNRNVFRGAEIFNLRLKGALEVSGETTTDEVIERLPFNTLELGLEAGFDFPKLLLPLPVELLSRNSKPKSALIAGINFRQRPDYTRYILNLNYGFEWNETSQKRHFINPIEISSVRIFNDSILRASIPDANPLILSRFRDHFILGSKYTYVYNSQIVGLQQDFEYFRGNVEIAGNLLNQLASNLGLELDENDSYNIFNIPFSQYFKLDADYRYYRVFDQRTSLVFRLMGGVGVPYGNVSVLPFIKSYFGGGANGLRAWRIYTLGPGGYTGTEEVRFDRYGDIKLETNLEYRFKFYSFWHGAFFLDAGNVWFVRENSQFPGGEFRFSQLGNDLALGGGFGVRMDFNFFILRVDAAVPLKDPSKPFADQWIKGWPSVDRFNLNLGIGYPF